MEFTSEEQQMLSYWVMELTGEDIEQKAAELEITVDYYLMEFM
jgi:RNA-splicing ligase RtcB